MVKSTAIQRYTDQKQFWRSMTDDASAMHEINLNLEKQLDLDRLLCTHDFLKNFDPRNLGQRCKKCRMSRSEYKRLANYKFMNNKDLSPIQAWRTHQQWYDYWTKMGLDSGILADADRTARSKLAVGKIRCNHTFESHRCVLCWTREADYLSLQQAFSKSK